MPTPSRTLERGQGAARHPGLAGPGSFPALCPISAAPWAAFPESTASDHPSANDFFLKKLPWSHFFIWKLLVHPYARNSIYHQMKFLKGGCYYFLLKRSIGGQGLVEAIKKTINIDWELGCCFLVKMAGGSVFHLAGWYSCHNSSRLLGLKAAARPTIVGLSLVALRELGPNCGPFLIQILTSNFIRRDWVMKEGNVIGKDLKMWALTLATWLIIYVTLEMLLNVSRPQFSHR